MCLKRILQCIFFLITSILCAYSSNAFNTHIGSYSIDTLQKAIEGRNWSDFRAHPWLTLKSIEVYESEYGTLSDNEKEMLILGSIEEDIDIDNSSSEPDYSDVPLGEVFPDWMVVDWSGNFISNRCENHFYAGTSNYGDGLRDNTLLGLNQERNVSAAKWAIESGLNAYSWNKVN